MAVVKFGRGWGGQVVGGGGGVVVEKADSVVEKLVIDGKTPLALLK